MLLSFRLRARMRFLSRRFIGLVILSELRGNAVTEGESKDPEAFSCAQATSGNSLQRSAFHQRMLLSFRSRAKAFPLSLLYRTCHPEQTPRKRSDRGGVEGSPRLFRAPKPRQGILSKDQHFICAHPQKSAANALTFPAPQGAAENSPVRSETSNASEDKCRVSWENIPFLAAAGRSAAKRSDIKESPLAKN